MKRSPKDESTRLHRARRAAERAGLDDALSAADRELQACRAGCLEALVQVCAFRPYEAMQQLATAINRIDQGRLALRKFFDQLGTKDDK